MARNKLITIRIESEKRQAFGDLAKSQNTDTASLLYDFISGCLSGEIDIKLVTGKGNWIDKIDNQIDSNRIDKLETATQRIDERVGQISKKLNDWVEAFDSRLNDCEKGLSEKITNLEHRLNALSIQLDSQRIDSEIGDMEPVATVEAVTDKVESAIETVESVTEIDESVDESGTSPIPNQKNVEAVTEIDEPVTGSIGPVPGDSIEPGKGEGMNPNQAHEYLISKGIEDISYYYLNKWAKDGVIDTSPKGKKVQKHLILRDGLYYPIN